MQTLLGDGNPHVRESAVKIAGYFGYAACAPALLDRCRDTDEAVRAAALEHIAYLDDERSVSILVSALANDTPRARAAAAQALGHANGPAALEALRQAVGDPDPWVRYFSVTSLGREADRASLPVLEQMAAHDVAPQVRIAAIGAIGEIGVVSEAAVQMLVNFTGSADDELAIAGLRALGSVDAPSVLEPLRRALSAAQPDRRAAAAAALARRGGEAAVELLAWTAAGDADHAVARAAIDGLTRIGDGSTPHAGAAIAAIAAVAGDSARRAEAIAALARVSDAAIPRVGAALASREAGVRCAVVEALGRLTHPVASEYVVTALSDGDASVRQAAVIVVARLGTRGVARTITGLAAADPSESVRVAAENALRRMGRGPADVASPPLS